MHECPECGQACDCDGEDVWNDIGSSDWMNCTHECDDFEEDDLMPDLDELDENGCMVVSDEEDDDSPKGHSLTCTCEHCIQDYPERAYLLDDDE